MYIATFWIDKGWLKERHLLILTILAAAENSEFKMDHLQESL